MAYSSYYEVILSIVAYSICSGTLVLLNKMTLYHLPFPSLVTSFQLAVAVCFIFTAKGMGWLPVDPVKLEFVIPYLYYIIGFALGVYCNMRSLSTSNVETVIVAKALSPCFVAFLDALFLGREYPSTRSWGAIALIGVGAFGYASHDEKFQTQGMSAYFWPLCYLLTISFEMAYGKSLLKSVKMKTQSGPVLYTNLLGITPMLLFATFGGEFGKFRTKHAEETLFTGKAIALLALGSAAGTGIGYSSWWCRGKVSATSFTIIGVMNKCLTILLNLVVWDQHAPPRGILSLLLCLAGGALYRQAPMRKVYRGGHIHDTDDAWETELTNEERNALLDAEEDINLAKRRPSNEA